MKRTKNKEQTGISMERTNQHAKFPQIAQKMAAGVNKLKLYKNRTFYLANVRGNFYERTKQHAKFLQIAQKDDN